MKFHTATGHIEITESMGRCQGRECKKKGGGMARIVQTTPIGDGIEKVREIVLCGVCLTNGAFDRLKPNADTREREEPPDAPA